ncbi:site-specific integrase [Paraburkholderia sp. CNPSo 3274]|uniref:tyrosine-type recombinase/integrase n=1 Tax=Paraburkholderia sp. CNPSo 3274 TaxID=2940932 RepID=UPI0020B756B8|nr:site-specific integrase [Paraburkholderia sp. CNPSo 3274]MCP3713135.1 site-specific integrase [Paraburkholderia sp. CNPSo 3274]
MADAASVVDLPTRRKRKNFVNAPKGTRLFRAHNGERTLTRDVSGIPLPLWPDGCWCVELAGYMHVLSERYLSLADRGGTPGTYASELSHLVRYCYAEKVDFHRMSNEQFEEFIDMLCKGKRPNGEPVRNSRTVVGIGRRSLEFLDYVGKRRGIPDFVAPDGPHIIANRKMLVRRGAERGASVVRYYWHHSCFPQLSAVTRRYPVPEDYINRLRKAAHCVKSSSFLKRRRLTLLRVLEATGARRIEVANLTVASVRAAKSMIIPYLELPTFKRSGGPEKRLVPIHHSELDFIIEYIDFYRASLVEREFGENDHGLVFVSEKSGAPITPNTITLELHILRKAAGIEGRAHPHLFRHRYITMALLRLIRAYEIKDKEHFGELLLKVSQFAQEVMERTGHTTLASLSRYVDWAFALSLGFDENRDAIDVGEVARAGRAMIAELETMRDTVSAKEFAAEIMHSLKGFVEDLSRVEGKRKGAGVGYSMLAKAVKQKE